MDAKRRPADPLPKPVVRATSTRQRLVIHLLRDYGPRMSRAELCEHGLAGPIATAKYVAKLLRNSDTIRSGLFCVDSALKILSAKNFEGSLSPSHAKDLISSTKQEFHNEVDGLICFEVSSSAQDIIIEHEKISGILHICELSGVTLLDFMCFSESSYDDWVSARRQNML